MDKTAEILASMLTENTGRHMLDSGGAYGRNWERNQGRDFEKAEPTTLSANHGYVEVTHNVYHWLKERVTYAEGMDRAFERFCEKPEHERETYFALVPAFLEFLESKGHTLSGIYGEGEPMTVNTYNGEDLLSQVLQYTYFNCEGPAFNGEFCLLSIHGGCDVRGGYTKPRAFECSVEEFSILDNARAGIGCSENHEHNWYTDDGCHWYYQGACGSKYDSMQLDKMEITKEDNDEQPTEGALHVRADGSVKCPFCSGTLHAGPY